MAEAASSEPVAAIPVPATSDAVAAWLISRGFSSVVGLRRDGGDWVGQGARDGGMLDFVVAPDGNLTTRAAP